MLLQNIPGISNNRIDFGGTSSQQTIPEAAPGNVPVGLTDLVSAQQNLEVPKVGGFKGIASDVLGAIGDAFLVQGGANPVYGPRKQQQKIAQAAEGFDLDPESAIARVSKVDVNAGIALRDKYNARQKEQANLAIAQAEGQRDQTKLNLEVQEQERKTAAGRVKLLADSRSYAGQVLSRATEENYPLLVQHLAEQLKANGLPNTIKLPATYPGKEEMKRIIDSTLQVDDLKQLIQGDTRLQIQEENVEVARERVAATNRAIETRSQDNATNNESRAKRDRENNEAKAKRDRENNEARAKRDKENRKARVLERLRSGK